MGSCARLEGFHVDLARRHSARLHSGASSTGGKAPEEIRPCHLWCLRLSHADEVGLRLVQGRTGAPVMPHPIHA